jgi:hypothetical protein
MKDQRLGPALVDSFPQARPADQISGALCLFPPGYISGHHLAAPDIDHQIQAEPDAAHTGGQVGRWPNYSLDMVLWPLAAPPCRAPLGGTGTAPEMGLAMGMEHSVQASLRIDVQPAIG